MFASNQSIEEIINQFRNKGIRITQPRKIILEYLMKSDKHPTVEEIYSSLINDHPTMSLATVYNNVNFLVDEGLLYEIKYSPKISRYDFYGNNHSHIICQKCGDVVDFHSQAIGQVIAEAEKETGFLIIQNQVELLGICPDCQENNE